MSKYICAICNNKLLDLGEIPDGRLYQCSYCNSKEIKITIDKPSHSNLEYGVSYRKRLDNTKVSRLITLFENQYHGPFKNFKLLDIGFGDGEFLKEMKNKGFDVTGLECDQSSINLIREKGINTFSGELGGEMCISQKFDIIILWDVLEHVVDIKKAISQLDSLSKNNTRIFLITPYEGSMLDTFANIERKLSFYKSQKIMNICLNRYHKYRFSIKGLKFLFEKYGFRIQHIESLSLFSLKAGEYTDGIAPGILKWTPFTVINKVISYSAMSFIKIFNIKNKIFLIAVKEQFNC